MNLRSFIIIFALAFLGGCAATVKRDSSDVPMAQLARTSSSKLVLNVDGSRPSVTASDWEGFKLEWKENFSEQAKVVGIPFEMQEGPPKPTGEDGTLLFVYVNDYRFIRPGTRYLTGVFSGNAYIESKLTFSDLKTGDPLGSRAANTSSSAWEGVFSAMTNKQVEAIAVEVFKQLRNGK
jgi:hypothetical protein